MRRGGGGANRSRVRCGAGRIAQPPSKYAPPPTCVLQVVHYISQCASSQTHLSVDSCNGSSTPPDLVIQFKGELIQDIFLSARAPMCARCVCPRPHAPHATRPRARARAQSTEREREPLHSPPRSRNTPRRLRSSLSLARLAPPLASRYSVRGVLLRGPPDRELKVGVRRLPERSRSVGSVD